MSDSRRSRITFWFPDVENLTGAGNFVREVFDNSFGHRIEANGGPNGVWLDGAGGNDTLIGGPGNDSLTGGDRAADGGPGVNVITDAELTTPPPRLRIVNRILTVDGSSSKRPRRPGDRPARRPCTRTSR